MTGVSPDSHEPPEAGPPPQEAPAVPLRSGVLEFSGHKVVVTYPPDRHEIEALAQEYQEADHDWESDRVKEYVGDLVAYLLMPIITDDFDFDEHGEPRDPQEAHAERRIWEREQLPPGMKARMDKNMLAGGPIGAVINTFNVMKLFSTMPGIQEDFKNQDSRIPADFTELMLQADTISLDDFVERYKTFSLEKKREFVDHFRQFVKRAVQVLLKTHAPGWLLETKQ